MKQLTIPDYLSISRLIIAPVLIILAVAEERNWAGWLLVIGVFTDLLDGWIARHFNQKTKRGARLDSAGDAVIFLAGAVAVIIFETDFVKSEIIPVAIALGLYFLQLILALWRYGRPSSFHTYSAKTAAAIQGVFLAATILFGPVYWLFYLAITISILETLEEIILIFLLPEWKTDIKGLYWVLKKRDSDEEIS